MITQEIHAEQMYAGLAILVLILAILYIVIKEKKRSKKISLTKLKSVNLEEETTQPPQLPSVVRDEKRYKVILTLLSGVRVSTPCLEAKEEEGLLGKERISSKERCEAYMKRDRFKVGNKTYFPSQVLEIEVVEEV